MEISIKRPKAEDVAQLKALWKAVFSDTDEFIDSFFRTAFSPERCLCAFDGNRLLANLYWFDCKYKGEKTAYIYAVATGSAFRGLGICSFLMTQLNFHLKNSGYCGAILVPSSRGLFDFYAKFGYTELCYINQFECDKTDGYCTNLKPITEERYALLRLGYLPDSSIIQEGENLDFASCFLDFYEGDGFIFCCRIEGNKLFVSEFLGNCEKNGEIVSSLGCDKGFFRTHGHTVPFAAFCPFSKIDPPNYFGLAFD